jgi:hypothetical protein
VSVTLFRTGLNGRHPLSPTKGLGGFTLFWAIVAFAAVSVSGVVLGAVAPQLGL